MRAFQLALVLALAGCGFRPVYAPDVAGQASPVATEYAAIDVALISDRPGQELRQAIQERLERFGLAEAKRYRLSVALSISNDFIGVQPDNTASYNRTQASASWTLTRLDPTATPVTQGRAHAVDGENQINNQSFFGELSNDSAVRKLTLAIADQITLQLGLYFRQHPPA